MPQIFSGIIIIDLTKVFSGPFCTRLFADYGATVIKIETAEHPDDSRFYPPVKNGQSGYFEMLNRGKQGVALDLKNSQDRQKFYQLCQKADVIVENLTPQTKFKLKIDYETIKTYKADIIYASLSGQGQKNNSKYYDILAQAKSGLMSLSGSPLLPMKIGPSVVDAFSGLMLAYGVASALFYKQKTGLGQYLDVSMLGAATQLLESNLLATSMSGINPRRVGNLDNAIAPFGVYRTQDGYLALAAGNETQWQALIVFLQENVEFDPNLLSTNLKRLQKNVKLTQIIESVFGRYLASDLLIKLKEIGVPCEVVNEMSDVLQCQELFASGDLIKMKHQQLGQCVMPGRNIRFTAETGNNDLPATAPTIGQHNQDYDL